MLAGFSSTSNGSEGKVWLQGLWPWGGPGEGKWGVHWLIPPSAVGSQLCLNVHSADGTFLAHGEPLVHTQLVEEVHTGEAPGREGRVRGLVEREGPGAGPEAEQHRLSLDWGPHQHHGGWAKEGVGSPVSRVRLWLGWEVMTRPSSTKPFQTSRKQSHDFVLDPSRPNITLLSHTLCPPVHTIDIAHLRCSTPTCREQPRGTQWHAQHTHAQVSKHQAPDIQQVLDRKCLCGKGGGTEESGLLPHIFSIFQHRQANCAFLICV